MPLSFSLESKYFTTIYNIHNSSNEPLEEDLLNYLADEEYILSQGKFGWALTNKGREFIKQYSNDRTFIDVIRADWPIDLIAILRRCELNSRPNLPEIKWKDLVHTGYLIESDTKQLFLTDKARQLLMRYPL